MAKEIIGFIKLQIAAGEASPAPPIGPALGQKGVNIMEFCKAFNAATQKDKGTIIPVIITRFIRIKVLLLLQKHHLQQCLLRKNLN